MDDGEALTHEIRAALGDRTVREVRMFGALCFMVEEKLALGVMKDGSLLVHSDPERNEELLAVA